MTDSTRGALVFAAIVGGAATILWLIPNYASHHISISLPEVRPDPEVRLCDQMVDALLHSKDLVEVTRAGILVAHVNCAIGKRLP